MFGKTYLLLFIVGRGMVRGADLKPRSQDPLDTPTDIKTHLTALHRVTRGFPAPSPTTNLPSMLTIASEEELGLYSKKWNLTPVQMCTLMGHQMTIAQPLLDINHPMVAHLPTIGEMAMSDAVMVCEKVLNDAKGRTATVTTVVEETRQEYAVPRNFLFDDDFGDLTDDLMESVGFSDDDLRAAMEDNAEALADLLSQKSEDDMRDDISGMIPKTEGNVFKKEGDVLTPVKVTPNEPPTTPEPSIAEKLRGKMYSD